MRQGLSRAARTSVAVLTALAFKGAMASPSSAEVTSLRIARLDVPAGARGEPREWRVVDAESSAARLADALARCATREIVKFKPKYLVVTTRADGSGTTFLVSGEYVKIDGVAFKCRQNVEDLIGRLWGEGPAAPADAGAGTQRPST
jgi:hypothetical protein